MTEPVEFDCKDCGFHVHAFGASGPAPERCCTCQWVIDHVAPEHRQQIRDRINDAASSKWKDRADG